MKWVILLLVTKAHIKSNSVVELTLETPPEHDGYGLVSDKTVMELPYKPGVQIGRLLGGKVALTIADGEG